MLNKKWNIYVVHHSHTDIGYTDLQETILYNQANYIKNVIADLNKAYKEDSVIKDFKWNCETYFCVEQFLEEATEEEKADFVEYIKKGNIGLSASYLNFTDLVDIDVLDKRTKEFCKFFEEKGIKINSAMNADINGISLGSLDVFLENGVEFLYTNIHCHHGMYPLYQNQKPYFWESKSGKKLLVWNGEHYNLGNALGIVYNKHQNFMTENYFGKDRKQEHLETLKKNLEDYINLCVEHGYEYDFIPVSVSGVFSDNAPPNTEIIETIAKFNEKYGDNINIQMVTISQLYEKIKDKTINAKTYKGDLTDWWAHGVPSTPYAVKHYKEAQRIYNLCNRLDPERKAINPKFEREAEDNLLLYSEHTWGHSSTITNPYDTMVVNLDMRKTSYASKAHESVSKNLHRILHYKGDKLRYYDRQGKIKAINTVNEAKKCLVEFYIEVWGFGDIKIKDEKNNKFLDAQVSSHPRGVLVSFVDYFLPLEEKVYSFEEMEKQKDIINSRVAYSGSERVRDIVNDYDKITYTLPYFIENEYFKIAYKIGEGVTSFYNKKENREMLLNGDAKFFTPIYENTKIRTDVYEERRRLGRNIRGLHAKKYIAELDDIKIIDNGKIFKTIELIYKLEGTYFSSVVIKLYNNLPRVDFKYKIAKTFSQDIENILLPLALDLGDKETFIDKGKSTFKPGVEQIDGTCMEYYLLDTGVLYKGEKSNIAINTLDAPMIYMGNLDHHPIVLCDKKEENNKRNVYSWIMNNIWETNFKMDLSGATEFCYSLTMEESQDVDTIFNSMRNDYSRVVTFMI